MKTTTLRTPLYAKAISAVLALLFLLFAIFQLNDPDWFTWMILYGYVSVVAAMAVFGKYNPAFLLPGIAIFGLYFFYQIPSVFTWFSSDDSLITGMSPDKMYVEESREAFGLLMGLSALVFVLLTRPR